VLADILLAISDKLNLNLPKFVCPLYFFNIRLFALFFEKFMKKIVISFVC